MGVLSIMIAEAQCPGSIVVLHEIGEFGEHFQTVEAEKEISAYDRQVGIGLHERLLKQGIEVFSTGKGSSAQVKVGSPQNGEGIPFIGYGEGLLFSYGLVKIERVLWYNKKFGMPVKVLKEFGVGQSVDDQIGGNSCCYEQNCQKDEYCFENPAGCWFHTACSLAWNSLQFHMKKPARMPAITIDA
ncbi:hypothetical protein DSECCO2_517710 [anaerobic digester metagenome]